MAAVTVDHDHFGYPALRAIAVGGESADSLAVQATPVSRGCSSGNEVVLENCYGGSSGWKVTSTGAGLSVPDWPTTYGHNMFVFPYSKWVGGIFYEHSHRLIASSVV